MKKFKPFFLDAAAMFLLLYPVPSKALTFNYFQIINNPTANIVGQLSFDVAPSGNGGVSFTFHNAVGIASNLTEIYFDDDFKGTTDPDLFTGITNVDNSSGVTFSTAENLTPSELPGGNTVNFIHTFGIDSAGGWNNGISSSDEWTAITLGLLSGITYGDVVTALNNQNLRVGVHVRAIGGGLSNSFVNSVAPIPEPATMFLFGSGLIGAAAVIRRRFKKQL